MSEAAVESRAVARIVGLVTIVFLAAAVFAWFMPLSRVGIGDWDWYFSDAWVSAAALRERGLPGLWSVQLAGGAPLAGDPESFSHSPLLALPLALGPIVGTKLVVVLLLATGLLGCHRLGMRWLGDALGARVFAFAFMFSGGFAIHLRAGHLPWAVFGLVPWILYFVDRLLFDAEPGRLDAAGFVGSLAILLTAQVYHALVFFLLPVAIVYGVMNGRRIDVHRARRILVLALCALGLAAPRLFAVIDWQDRHPRPVYHFGTIPLAAVAAMLFTPIADYKAHVSWGGSGIWEYWSYVGVFPLGLALGSAVWRGPARGLALAFIVAGVVLVWQSPWGNLLAAVASHLPFLASTRIYSRFLIVTVFGLSLAAGSGAAALRSRHHGRVYALLLFGALAAEYAFVVLPIWQRVFDQPVRSAYPDWDVTLPGLPYHQIRRAPPFQDYSADADMFNSRMLPLLMAGAVVSNAYVTLALPWLRPPAGDVVEDWPPDNYRVSNHEIEISGDLAPGRVIDVNLHYSKRDWKVADRSCAAIVPHGAGMRVEIRKACPSVQIVYRSGLDFAGWLVAAGALVATAMMIPRAPTAHRADAA